jgi:hypothetical protein
MIAISSHRDMDDNPEVAANQERAIRSWCEVFEEIYLIGKPDPRLDHPEVTYIEGLDFPAMSLLFLIASKTDQISAILNADIVVSPHLKGVITSAFGKGAFALTSRRYEFDPAKPNYEMAKVVDLGADFFCAWPWVWHRAWKAVPTAYRMGNPTWDNWLLGFLGLNFKRTFADIGPARAIFHPRHTERKRIPLEEAPRDKYITSGLGFPRALT